MSDVQLEIAALKAGSEEALRDVPEEQRESVYVNVRAADIVRLIDALEAAATAPVITEEK